MKYLVNASFFYEEVELVWRYLTSVFPDLKKGEELLCDFFYLKVRSHYFDSIGQVVISWGLFQKRQDPGWGAGCH